MAKQICHTLDVELSVGRLRDKLCISILDNSIRPIFSLEKPRSAKCISLHLGRHNDKHGYHMEDTELVQVLVEKDLGV